MTLKEIDARKKELKEILQKDNEVTRLTELKRLAKEVGASAARFEGMLSDQYQSLNRITEGEIVHNIPGAASGRNQTKRLKCKTQNFGIPASRDNSLLSKDLSRPCQKNTQKKQELERL